MLVLALVEARFPTGTHELYQLPLGLRPADEGWSERVIAEVEGWTVYDALGRPAQLARELLHRMRGSADVERARRHAALPLGRERRRRARRHGRGAPDRRRAVELVDRVRRDADPKAFRRLEPGVNPELELLRFLSDARVRAHRAAGRLVRVRRPADRRDARHAAGVPRRAREDGWELCLDRPRRRSSPRARDLGAVTGELHTVLGSETGDPDFAPEEPSGESLSLLTATIDEEIERVFVDLDPDDPALGADRRPRPGRARAAAGALARSAPAGG